MFLGTAQQNIITIYKAKLGIGAGFAGIPDAVLHIKQANEWGLSMENYLNTDKWTLGILGGGDLYLSFNHSLLGNFNKSTGEYSYISDVKLKTEVRYVNAIWLDKLMQLRPATYLMKSQEAESTGRHLGFIAQDVQVVFPEAVFENERGLLMLNYDKLEVLAIKAIQEQQEAINELKKQNEQMKGEIEALKHSGHPAGNK
jgi:hypothetical protein